MPRRIRQWIGFLIMLAGLGFLCGPFLLGAKEGRAQEQVVDRFYQELDRGQPAAEPALPSEPDPEPEPEAGDAESAEEPATPAETAWQDAFYQAAAAYNDALVQNGQEDMNSRADVEQFALRALDYGYSENIIGTIQIPRMEIELGLYLGASADNMAKGAAIFGMTSLPLGRENENVAIAGHRGWNGTALFRDIQLLQMDDPIYITTPWQTLVYRVCGIEIVDADDNGWCKLQPGKTMISLMTCHPYGKNTHRYIVFAELCQEEKPSQTEIQRQNQESFDPAPRAVTLVSPDGSTQTVSVDPVSIEPDGSEYGAVWSNAVILAENKMKTVAWIAAVLVGLAGIWLLIVTVRDLRKKGENGHESE